MATLDCLPSSPPGPSTSSADAIAYYKAQYESLEAELAEFQNSSKELEAEMEKDIDASEKRERQLKEKVGDLGFEVDEWKAKYKQSKSEASSAQNALQKEVTTLRESNRSLQMRLRDTEVANDDFERQQRNTASSLEDLESKYSMAIERSVMMEEEIKAGEQERETLRIETQRLRDELSDLRIEAEITKEKWTRAEKNGGGTMHLTTLLPPPASSTSPRSELSPTTSDSAAYFDTPPSKTASSSGISDAPTSTSPSPPTSEASVGLVKPVKPVKTPSLPQSRLSLTSSNTTPRPAAYPPKPSFHTRGPSVPDGASNHGSLPSTTASSSHFRSTGLRPNVAPLRGGGGGLAQSNSIHHLHNLQGKMQRLTERVHTAKSKLPAPVHTPPKSSPRATPANASSSIPATVTVRSSRKRPNSGRRRSSSSRMSGGEESWTEAERAERGVMTPSSTASTSTSQSTSLRAKSSIRCLQPASTAMRPPAAPTRLTTNIATGTAANVSPDRSARHGGRDLGPADNHHHLISHSRSQSHNQSLPSRPASRTSVASGTTTMSSGMHPPPLGLNKRVSQHFHHSTPRPNASTDRVRPKSSLSHYGYDGACDLDDRLGGSPAADVEAVTPTPVHRVSGVGRMSDMAVSGIPTPKSARVSVSRLPGPTSTGGSRPSLGGSGRPSSSSSSRPTSRHSILGGATIPAATTAAMGKTPFGTEHLLRPGSSSSTTTTTSGAVRPSPAASHDGTSGTATSETSTTGPTGANHPNDDDDDDDVTF